MSHVFYRALFMTIAHTPSTTAVTALPPKTLIFWACALIFVAFNLRTIFPSFGALMPEIRTSLHLSAGFASLITTLPVLCLGIFAPFAFGKTIHLLLLMMTPATQTTE